MNKDIAYKTTSFVLKWGSWLAVVILILGLLLFLIHPTPTQYSNHSWRENLWNNLSSFDSQAFINLGILLLMLVPFFRVLTILISFMLEKDKKYSWISLGVLLLLILGIFLAINQV